MLGQPGVDAVVCSVADHWHAPVILDSLKAGKHVYVIPPLCRYLPEAFDIWDACVRSKRILQLGVFACSDRKWQTAGDLIKAGRIGQVVMLQGSYMRNNPRGEWNYSIQPWATRADVNQAMWERPGKSASEAFDPERYFRWYKYYRYSSGLLSGLLSKKVNPYLMAMGTPEFPKRVAAIGTKPVHSDVHTLGAGERDCPEIIQVLAEFPSGATMSLTSSSVNERGTQEMIRGHQASLILAGDNVELRPEPAFASEIQPERFGPFHWETLENHFTNWIESIRGNQRPNCGIELAVRGQVLLSMAEMSHRLNTVCLFNEATRKVTDAFGKEVVLL